MEGEVRGGETKIILTGYQAVSCQFLSSVGGASTEFNSCEFHCTFVLVLKLSVEFLGFLLIFVKLRTFSSG